MKLLDPEMKNFQNKMQAAQKTGDWEGMKQAKAQFSILRERYGISTILPLLSLLQVYSNVESNLRFLS
jgi:uncharacterized membrane protein (DUF106 family)